MILHQRTLAKQVSVTGIGLHSGKKVKLTLLPAPTDFGIQFQRTDIPRAPKLKADAQIVGATENNTTLGLDRNQIHTVEHLLSVLYGLCIDNLLCEIDGPEVPIMDGSSSSFVFLLKEAGIVKQAKDKKFMIILETIECAQGDKWAKISPSTQFEIDSTIIFPHPIIGEQRKLFRFSSNDYIKEISRARTFGLLSSVEGLKRKGLIKGGSLDNAVVLDDYKVMNPEGLRFANEFVRHKILDTIGDMALLGPHPIIGKITTYKSGHNIHNQLCRKLLNSPNSFQIFAASELSYETRSNLESLYFSQMAYLA